MSLVGAVRRANAKGRAEESIALRVTVLIAVVAAATATVAQGVGGPLLTIAATAGIAGGFAYSHYARHREGYGLKAFLAIAVLVAFGQFIQSTSGLDAASINQLQYPLAELFLWVQVLHSLDVPARRDLLFSLVSSLVLIAVAGVLSTSSGLGLNLAVWAVAALASLVLAHRSELHDHVALEVVTPSAGPAPAHAGPAWRPIITMAALVLALATAVFLVLPAAGAGRAVAFPARLPNNLPVPNQGGLANPSLGGDDPASPDGSLSSTGGGRTSSGYFGFSDRMDTGTRGRPDDTLVMRVRASRPDFWRGQTFDTWDGRTWTQSDQRIRATAGDAPIELVGANEDRAYTTGMPEFVQTVHVEEGGPNLIFAAYAPERLYFSDRRVFEMSDGTIRTGVQLPKESVYTVVSRRPAVTEELLRASGEGAFEPDDATVAARYTRLPADVPDRVTRLANDLRSQNPNRYDFVRAIEQWMAANTSYTLDIPPLPRGADAVEQFLFEDRQGFCEQIASAMVVMLRSQGVPARLAVGYAPGTRNPFTGMWEVRARDAHAWTEVWFPGVGWQAFDPTASVPFAGDPFSSAASAGIVAYVKTLLPDLPDGAAPFVLGVIAIAATAAFAWPLLARERARRRHERSRSWADATLQRLERLGEQHGRSRRPWETTAAYADTLAVSVLPDARVRTVATLIDADAYAPNPDQDRRLEAERILLELETAAPHRR